MSHFPLCSHVGKCVISIYPFRKTKHFMVRLHNAHRCYNTIIILLSEYFVCNNKCLKTI